MSSSKRKTEFLGMPHGTAVGRLRKNVLFHILKKHGENVCERCKGTIEKVEDLSLEHIKPWENVSVDLFWDLENIAFSHLHCNRPHIYNSSGAHMRKVGPEGTAWCGTCQKFEPLTNFHKHASNWNGLQKTCKYNRRDRPPKVY
jgi:HNH endonuclease